MSSNMGIPAPVPAQLPIPDQSEDRCVSGRDLADLDYVIPLVSMERDAAVQKCEETELMRALATGDDAAMAILFAKYHKLVRSIAVRIIRDHSEAEDVVQVVFFDLFRAADSFDSCKGSIKAWVLQYAYHRALHRKRHLVANRFYEWEEFDSSPQCPVYDDPELRILISQLVAYLDDAQKDVIQLAYFEGFTAEEISSRLRKSVHVVRHDLRRAICTMRTVAGSHWAVSRQRSTFVCEGVS